MITFQKSNCVILFHLNPSDEKNIEFPPRLGYNFTENDVEQNHDVDFFY